MSDDKPKATPERPPEPQDSEDKRKPKATLIKRKPEPPRAVEPAAHQDRDRNESGRADGARPETERRRIVVVKKSRRTVVLKRKPSAAAGSESAAGGAARLSRPAAAAGEPPPPPTPRQPAAPRPAPAPAGTAPQSPPAPRSTPDAPAPKAAERRPGGGDGGTATSPPARADRSSSERPAQGAVPERRPESPGRRPPPPPRRGPAPLPGQREDRSTGAGQPRDAAAGRFGPGRRLTTSADRIRAAEEPLRPVSRARDSDQPLPEIRDRFRRRPAARTPGRGRMPPPRTGGFRAPGERSPGGGRPSASGPRGAGAPLRGRPPAGRGGGRLGLPRGGGPRGGGPRSGGPPPPPISDGRTGGKKFFRTKRRSSLGYHIGPEEHEEKVSLARKKPVPVANPVPKEIDILEVITVSELARKLNLKASDLIAKLMAMGTMVTINQQIDADTATLLADEYGCKVNVVSLFDETVIEEDEDTAEKMQPRPPIVTIMGHVDHGKTKLLDAIRQTNVADGEAGGITQHIGAYSVDTPRGRIAFLDTPGHAAFTEMRARGARLTDIVVLVVAADDGLMPQTVEAINHAKAANVPIIVAVNKIDLPEANPERVRQQLSGHELISEEWGGSTLFNEISALNGTGIEELLDNILLQAELMELKANYQARAVGRVVESAVDLGRGIVATVMIQKGTLHTGDSFVGGVFPGKVRAMFTDRGERVAEATPAQPIQIVGLAGLPEAGDPFQATESEKTARQVGAKRQELKKAEEAQNVTKVTLDNLYQQISEGEAKELKLIIKGDVHGSVEALRSALERLSTAEIKLSVIHSAAGAVNKDDVALASASNAIIVGFHIRPAPNAQALADQEKVEIRKYDIIYEVIDDVRAAMEGLLTPDIVEDTVGSVEVRELFRISRVGTIAGSYVLSGTVRRGALAQVIRDGRPMYRGRIVTLRRFKDDVREVESGFECGIRIEGFNDVKVGDTVDVIEQRTVAKKLGEPTTNGSVRPTRERRPQHVGSPAEKG